MGDRQRILNLAEELSNDGLKALGVASKRLNMIKNNGQVNYDDRIESDMVFLGFISFYDPPKESAKQALGRLAEKGVKAKVLTGDSLSIAIRICKEVGIKTTHVITSPDLEFLGHYSFHEMVKQATALARLTPTQKLRVVQSLQTVGDHDIGFLGDEVNDSLALDAANVGISVDSGAPIAKDLADIILLEKDLNVLVAGVEHGRLTIGNTMKYIKMSVIANLGSILSLFIATLSLGIEPLTPRQLLTQNFLYNVGQIAIPWDKIEKDCVKTPQKWTLKGLTTFLLWNGTVCSLCDLATLLFLLYYYRAHSPVDSRYLHSTWFIEGLLMQTLIIHLIRTERIPFIQEVASWPVILSTVASYWNSNSIYTNWKCLGLCFSATFVLWILGCSVLGYFSIGQLVKRGYILVYKKWL